MKKSVKFNVCDWSLLVISIAMLASGLQVELNPEGAKIWVWIHIIIGVVFMADIFWHLRLHNWPRTARARNQKNPWLEVFFLLTLISGTIATIHWLDTFTHSTIGGIHGKLGFVMIIAVVVHISKHIKFYKNQIAKKRSNS